ncbi:MAG TPA: hypothetical protein VGE52_17340 [Pirellulales bacterium]
MRKFRRLAGVRAALAMTLALSVVGTLGCLSAPTDEDEHMSHAIPAHQPADFATATVELARRSPFANDSLSDQQSASTQRSSTRLLELQDVIDWLPGLAADTRMKKAEWDRVQAASNELKLLVAPLLQASPSSPSISVEQRERYDQLVAELQALAAETARLDGLR